MKLQTGDRVKRRQTKDHGTCIGLMKASFGTYDIILMDHPHAAQYSLAGIRASYPGAFFLLACGYDYDENERRFLFRSHTGDDDHIFEFVGEPTVIARPATAALVCVTCREPADFAEPNLSDGRFQCWSCRQTWRKIAS